VFGSKIQISRTTQICSEQNSSGPADFKIAQLLNCLSYQGVKITVEKITKCSTTLVFGSRLDFLQSSPSFALIDCFS
jgi:hypothetical protein